jgi:hypothetical protein
MTRRRVLCFTRGFAPECPRCSDGDPSVTSAPRRLRRLLLGVSAATVLSASAVAVAISADGPEAPVQAEVLAAPSTPSTTPAPSVDLAVTQDRVERKAPVSRSAKRVTMRKKPDVVARKFMTAPLNLWPAPREKGRAVAVLSRGHKVGITGVRRGTFAQIMYGGQIRWVHRAYLADKMPKPKPKPQVKVQPRSVARTRVPSTPRTHAGRQAPAHTSVKAHGPRRAVSRPARSSSTGVSSAPCPDGSSTESGLTPSAVTLFRAVCNAFPALTTYGGYDGHGEHSSGKAIDFMVGSSSLGQAVADWARAHAGQLHLYDVIWAQHIWTPARASEGWRLMPDRGSATANHYDHVHISVN